MIENPNEMCKKPLQGPIPLLSIKGQSFNLNDTKKMTFKILFIVFTNFFNNFKRSHSSTNEKIYKMSI
jgi:hypothetical protein